MLAQLAGDAEQVDIWTSELQTGVALERSPLRPMPLVALAQPSAADRLDLKVGF